MDDLGLGLTVGVIIGAAGIAILMWLTLLDIEQAAIERDYALHCPLTGDFAWKGECDG